jgi:hypothetical protein
MADASFVLHVAQSRPPRDLAALAQRVTIMAGVSAPEVQNRGASDRVGSGFREIFSLS